MDVSSSHFESNQKVSFYKTASVIFILASAVQLLSLLASQNTAPVPLNQLVIQSLVFVTIVNLPATLAGLYLGRKIGLGAPDVETIIARPGALFRQITPNLIWAIKLGLVLGLMVLLIRYVNQSNMPANMPAYGFRGFWGGTIVSLGATAEEVWFRLGLMTVMCFGVLKVSGKTQLTPQIVWGVIIVSGMFFGAAHIPHLMSYSAATPFTIVGTVLGNTFVSMGYGYAYWKRGLLAAMFLHFFADITIHALPALF
ncbi:CPBP family intramembrane glutamic endopeptidase [Neptunicella marina]|uniref:CPBP family intramembrane metalloprotease n=1 Tax=Neptunicella marina TaxID=2125989 RepID=A0A8J6IRX2_9ALTE|nr:CPBP family intramembrane glutamic endopeptidase [Neptunicella marina]MBC3766345.1 CPBP family intramembrane metalloprotease [Neptunicella marina]